jgi:hypothetical protein
LDEVDGSSHEKPFRALRNYLGAMISLQEWLRKKQHRVAVSQMETAGRFAWVLPIVVQDAEADVSAGVADSGAMQETAQCS